MRLVHTKIIAQSVGYAKTVVKVRGFEMVLDEPLSLGGTNEAPTPVEYMLAGLAGCINVIAQMVAKERGLLLNSLEINIDGSLEIQPYEDAIRKSAVYSEINVEIMADMEADELTKEKWIQEVEGRCPVSRTLTSATPVNFKLL